MRRYRFAVLIVAVITFSSSHAATEVCIREVNGTLTIVSHQSRKRYLLIRLGWCFRFVIVFLFPDPPTIFEIVDSIKQKFHSTKKGQFSYTIKLPCIHPGRPSQKMVTDDHWLFNSDVGLTMQVETANSHHSFRVCQSWIEPSSGWESEDPAKKEEESELLDLTGHVQRISEYPRLWWIRWVLKQLSTRLYNSKVVLCASTVHLCVTVSRWLSKYYDTTLLMTTKGKN